MEVERIKIRIYGTVQGVFFRSTARKIMDELGLKGWIRNCDDGCVETEVEGDTHAVEQYRAWCKIGPAGAKVERVEEEEGEAKGYVRFDIRG